MNLSNISLIFHKLTKYDYYTILSFIIGFTLSVLDFDILKNIELYLTNLSNLIFISTYLLTFFFIFFSLKILILNTKHFRIEAKDKQKILKGLKIFLIGYFLGYVINLSNAYIIIFFEKFIIT